MSRKLICFSSDRFDNKYWMLVDKIGALYQEYARLDDYKYNSLKVKKFKLLIRMVKRVKCMTDEDEDEHEEWVKSQVEGYEHTIKRLFERRITSPLHWK